MDEQPQIIAGRYELDKVVGRGGMGDVFVATDTQSGDTVAVKLLKPEVVEDDPTLLERFEREGQALRKLNHPNIVKMLASLEEYNQHYLVMEYVSGGSLQELIQNEGQLPLQQALEIGLDLADALTRAHRLKIIHRDIKPANVLIAEDGTPKLTDFGVAHIGDRTAMTATGSLIGTYNYLSPEAVNGDHLDERADIWSFGVMIYEMLTGRRPFEDPKVPAVLMAIIMKPAPDITKFRDDLPPVLVNLIYGMLEKDPEGRVESARIVGAELESILRNIQGTGQGLKSRFYTPTPSSNSSARAATQSTPPSLSSYLSQITSNPQAQPTSHKGWKGILTGLLIVIVLSGIVWFFALNGDDENSMLKVEPVTADEIMVMVAHLEPVDVEPRSIGPFIVENLVQTLQTSYSFSKIRIREYPAIITSDAQAQAIAEANGAVVIVWGAYDDEFINIEVQLGVTDAYPQIPFDRELLENTANVDVRLTDEHEQSVAPQVLGALATLQNAAGDGVEASRSLAILEGLDVTSGEILGDGVGPNAQRFFATYIEEPEQALETITAAIEADPGNPLIYVLLAIVKLHLGDVDSALLDLGTAERLGPDEWPIPLFVRANIALTEDHIESAIRAYDTLIELRPEDWFPYSIRGGLYYLTGDYLLAQSDLDRSLELSPTANFPYTFSIILALRDGRITDAFNNIQFIVNDFPDTTLSTRMMRAIGTENSLLGPIFPAVGNLILGQYEAALTDIDVALAIDDNLAELYMMQGLAYCSLEDFEAAEAAYSNAIERDPEFALLYMLRANARFELNNLAAALEDVGIAQGFSLGAEFDTLLDAGMAGEVTCQNFFDYQP